MKPVSPAANSLLEQRILKHRQRLPTPTTDLSAFSWGTPDPLPLSYQPLESDTYLLGGHTVVENTLTTKGINYSFAISPNAAHCAFFVKTVKDKHPSIMTRDDLHELVWLALSQQRTDTEAERTQIYAAYDAWLAQPKIQGALAMQELRRMNPETQIAILTRIARIVEESLPPHRRLLIRLQGMLEALRNKFTF